MIMALQGHPNLIMRKCIIWQCFYFRVKGLENLYLNISVTQKVSVYKFIKVTSIHFNFFLNSAFALNATILLKHTSICQIRSQQRRLASCVNLITYFNCLQAVLIQINPIPDKKR